MARDGDGLPNPLGSCGGSKACHALQLDRQPTQRSDSEVLAQAFKVLVALFLLK